MVNELMFNEIMKMPSEKKGTVIFSLEKMSKYCTNIKLLTNEKNEVFYQVDAKALKELDIDPNDLLMLNQSGWVLSANNKFLEYYI
jgi:hypothetical protein